MTEDLQIGKAEILKPDSPLVTGGRNVTNNVMVNATQCYKCPFRKNVLAQQKRQLEALTALIGIRERIYAFYVYIDTQKLDEKTHELIEVLKNEACAIVGQGIDD